MCGNFLYRLFASYRRGSVKEKKDDVQIMENGTKAAEENIEAKKAETESAGSNDAPTDIVQDSPGQENSGVAVISEVLSPSSPLGEESKEKEQKVEPVAAEVVSAKVEAESSDKAAAEVPKSPVEAKVEKPEVPKTLEIKQETSVEAKPETPKAETPVEEVKPPTPVVTKPETPVEQAKPETPVEAKPPTPVETKPETPVEPAKPETPVEAKPPTPVETKFETPVEQAKPETPVEVKPPTPVDDKPETTVQVQPPTPVEDKPETPVEEVKPQTPVEAKPETPVEEQPSTPVETKPETPIEEVKPQTPDVKPETPVEEVKPETPVEAKPESIVDASIEQDSIQTSPVLESPVKVDDVQPTIAEAPTSPIVEDAKIVEPQSNATDSVTPVEELAVQDVGKPEESSVEDVKVETSPANEQQPSLENHAPLTNGRVNGEMEHNGDVEESNVTLNGQETNGPLEGTTLIWKNGGDQVSILGDFNQWEDKCVLHKQDDVFSTKIKLPKGTHHLKYIVDGIETVDESQPTVELDGHGQVNVLTV